MTPAAVRRQRRRGAALLVAAQVCALVAAFLWHSGSPARADTTLSSYGLQAGARGWRLFDEDAANGNQEAEVPESSANLANGPLGYGLASVVWPGPLASNAGSLILVLRPDAPPEATMLNNPIRAEARTGQNPPTTTNNSTPGTSMVATAKDDLVEAEATVNGSTGGGEFGPTRTYAVTTVTGATARSASESLVQDISLAEGVVKIDSVASVAEATTDGAKSDGEAHTVVQGMTIGGMPATIDEEGLHIGAQSQPANAAANQIAQQALGQSGTSIALSQPTKETNGATTSVTAGSLVVSWDTGGGQIFTVTIGGAQAGVTAALGTGLDLLEGDVLGPTGVASGAVPGTDIGSVSVPTGDAAPSASPAASGVTGLASERTSPALNLTGSGALVGTGSVVLALLATGLAGVGMRRLSDAILAEPATAVCPLAEDE